MNSNESYITDIRDNRAQIYEVQSYLRRIAQVYNEIPLIIADGIYSYETEEAVRAFQTRYGIKQTGEVDRETFDAIFQIYSEAQFLISDGMYITPFPDAFYVSEPNEKSDFIKIVQVMMETMQIVYTALEAPTVTGVNDEQTQNVIRYFQRANLLEETGLIDKMTWQYFAEEYNRISKNSSMQ